jgi:ribosomal protein S18 acetylase RimI-like enzyme
VPVEAAPRLLRAGGFTARVRPWPGEPGTVHLVTVESTVSPSHAAITGWLNELAGAGVQVVRTGALGPTTQSSYLEMGFTVRQELALLTHSLATVPALPRPSGVRLRRATEADLVTLAMLDRRAFGAQWGLDVTGLVDACHATPSHRLRIAATRASDPAGFAITGRAGRSGYLQRLAVHPARQRMGLARLLVIDGLRWAKRHRCTSVLVNTHVDNDAALGLYRRLDFTELSYRLAVLEKKLT